MSCKFCGTEIVDGRCEYCDKIEEFSRKWDAADPDKKEVAWLKERLEKVEALADKRRIQLNGLTLDLLNRDDQIRDLENLVLQWKGRYQRLLDVWNEERDQAKELLLETSVIDFLRQVAGRRVE